MFATHQRISRDTQTSVRLFVAASPSLLHQASTLICVHLFERFTTVQKDPTDAISERYAGYQRSNVVRKSTSLQPTNGYRNSEACPAFIVTTTISLFCSTPTPTPSAFEHTFDMADSVEIDVRSSEETSAEPRQRSVTI
jgi:hypothetical protein